MNNITEIKWFNYFNNIRNKYNTRVSSNNPLIILLSSQNYNKNNTNFEEILQNSAKFFSNRYNCISICKKNEISFIFEDSNLLINSINDERIYRTHDIVSIFSQYFFEHFHNLNKDETIYWSCKCFNINKEKITSYLKYKKSKSLYFNGNSINFDEFLKGNILTIKDSINTQNNFLSLSDFDNFL